MTLYVVNSYYEGSKGFRHTVCGSQIIGLFHNKEDCKQFVDKIQKEYSGEFFSVDDVYGHKIIYRSEDGWLEN